MKYILGIKFRDYGQIYLFMAPENANAASSAALTGRDKYSSPGSEGGEGQVPEEDLPACFIRVGDIVIAETGQGLGLGTVVHVASVVPIGVAAQDLKPIVRATTDTDQDAIAENRRLAADAMRYCTARIRDRELDMKLVDVEVLFDKSKFVFYFTAPTRIDFRELVKDLVREYHARIELRQIGVRHETQMIGAIGNCGMVCCCRRFLRKFAPVTIKMAKEQNLFLNPTKISGICGRLLCCLSYEQENYDAFHRECPRLGKRYLTKLGDLKILRANMFRNSVITLNENNEEVELTLDEWRATEPRRPDGLSLQPGSVPGEKIPRSCGDNFIVVAAGPDNTADAEEVDFAGEDGGHSFFVATQADWDARAAGEPELMDTEKGERERVLGTLSRGRRKRRRRPQS